ncbi:MAG: hypothetical protein HQL74_15930 [Magnetococcales bacterium]|nr:hypothetical protein [Magnetococcales bacterium]
MKGNLVGLLWMTMLLFAACARIPTSVEYQSDAGRVDMMVVPVGTWEQWRDEMAPKFVMESGESALKLVDQDTRQREYSLSKSLNMIAKAALPTHSLERTVKDITGAQDQPDTHTSDTTQITKSGEVPQVSEPKPNSAESKAAALLPENTPGTTPLARDPMMKYWTANALYQEVKLLDKYLERAYFGKNYIPYVVRVNVRTTPFQREADYDVYTTLSIFNESNDPSLRRKIRVVPLLVADNLESTSELMAHENVRQMGLGLLGMLQGIGFSASSDALRDELERMRARSFNSLLSVGQVGENTVGIRLGAMQGPDNTYRTVPRNSTVTLLVLVEKDSRNEDEVVLQAYSNSIFRNSQTGEKLKTYGGDVTKEGLQRVANQFYHELEDLCGQGQAPPKLLTVEQLHELLVLVVMNDQIGFSNRFTQMTEIHNLCIEKGVAFGNALWTGLLEMAEASKWRRHQFMVPMKIAQHPPLPLMPIKQTALLVDDTTQSTVILKGGKNITKDSKFLGHLVAYKKKHGASCPLHHLNTKPPTFDLLADKMIPSEDGTSFTFIFPSVKGSQLSGDCIYVTVKAVDNDGKEILPTQEYLAKTVKGTPKDACADTSQLSLNTGSETLSVVAPASGNPNPTDLVFTLGRSAKPKEKAVAVELTLSGGQVHSMAVDGSTKNLESAHGGYFVQLPAHSGTKNEPEDQVLKIQATLIHLHPTQEVKIFAKAKDKCVKEPPPLTLVPVNVTAAAGK